MYHKYTNRQPNWTTLLDNLIGLSFISWGPCLTSLRPIDAVCLLVGTSKLKTVHLQGFWPKTVYLKNFGTQEIKNRASSRLLAKNRVSQVFWDPIKNRVSPRSVLLKAVYLEALLYNHLLFEKNVLLISKQLKQLFLTLCQNNFRNKVHTIFYGHRSLYIAFSNGNSSM